MSKLLPEWLDMNFHNAYPLASTTAAQAGTLPSRILLDALLLCGGPFDWTTLYINKVVCDETAIRLYISGELNGVDTELGELVSIPMNSARYTEIPIELKSGSSGCLISGYVTVGDVSSAPFTTTVTTLNSAQGRLYSGVVVPITEWVGGLVVNGELYTGAISLIAGSGVSFSAATLTKGGVQVPVIYVNCSDAINEDYAGAIKSDAEMLDYIYSTYGAPVYTLAGVYPDADGNIDFKLSETSSDPSVSVVNGGNGVISVVDDRTLPCCNDDDIQVVVNNISELNQRYGRLDSALTVLDSAINNMNSQLATLQERL